VNGRFYVGEWLVEPEQSRLVRGSESAKLDPKAVRVLSFFADHPNEVLTKEQIIGSVWDGAFVSDEVLTTAIWGLRKALGDDAKEPRYIQTMPRRGYRLIAPVERGSVESSRRWEPSPYPGLCAFSQRDAEYFFGREREVEALWTKLQERTLLGLIGPSGAGKSSLLRAGLIPAAPEGWEVVLCQPRKEVFERLAAAFEEWGDQKQRTLWVVDQFEELFTLNDEETQQRFAELLGLASESGIHVLLSMRDDFLMRCHDFPSLEPVFEKLTPVKALDGAALRRALAEPVRVAGYRFEDEALVTEILTELSREKGALPLLAFAASRLWEKRDREGRRLTREAYLSIGGVAGALAQHAEETLSGIGAERQAIVREIFRNLTTGSGTRLPLNREELLTVFGDREFAEGVLAKLIDARLLTSAGGEVEIIHESLLSVWPRLVRWRAQDAEGAVLRDQLRQAARLWEEKRRPSELLWTGTAYDELKLWRERYPGSLTALEEDFARSMEEKVRRKKGRARLATAAAFLAISAIAITIGISRNQALKARDRAEASKLLALAELRLQEDPTEALAFAIASLEQADSEEARVFAMKSLWEAPPAFELATGSENMRVAAFSPDGKWLAGAGHAKDALVWFEDGRGPIVLPGHEVSPRGPNVALWASKDLLVTGPSSMQGDGIHLWSLPEGRRIRSIDFGGPTAWQVGPLRLLAETHEQEEENIRLLRSWTLPEGQASVLGRINGTKLGAQATLFAPDGESWLYEKGRDWYARPLPEGAGPDRIFARFGADVTNLAVGHEADRLAIADASGDIHVWGFTSQGIGRERVIHKPDSAANGVLPDPTGRWLSGNPDAERQVRIWDIQSWRASRPLALRRNGSWYGSVSSFDPTGNWVVATTGTWSRLTFWPVAKFYPTVVDGYESLTRPLAFSADGKWLATSWGDGNLRLWHLPDGGAPEVRTLVRPGTRDVKSLAFDPKGRYVFAVGNRGQAWIVPVDGSASRQLPGFSEKTLLGAAAVSPSGRRVATAFWFGQGDKALRVWDLETGEIWRFDLPHVGHSSGEAAGNESGIAKLSFVGESTLYTAGDGGLRRWNLDSGSHEIVSAASPGYWMAGSFSEDGRVALTAEWSLSQPALSKALVHDLIGGTSRELMPSTRDGTALALDPSGTVAATGSVDGIVRVGLSGEERHLLVGHRGAIDKIAISPDLRWIVTTGQDQTLRLWPMPDLSKPALHTLPHDDLLAKLRSLTNLHAVRDPASATGWKVEVGPFPGWKTIPDW
jgi:WD40 repeat protein/DNA-binding winged helix-turn-helix (wHTH) protein